MTCSRGKPTVCCGSAPVQISDNALGLDHHSRLRLMERACELSIFLGGVGKEGNVMLLPPRIEAVLTNAVLS